MISTNAGRPHIASRLRIASLLLAFAVTAGLAMPIQAQTPATHPAAKAPAQAEPWTKIPVPPLHAFKPKEPRRIELPNGLVLFLQEDHELPFVNGFIIIRGGSRDGAPPPRSAWYRSTDRHGAPAAASPQAGDTLDTQLASKAASIETGGSIATTSMSWSSLKGDFDSVFGSAIDLLMHPDLQGRQTRPGQARDEGAHRAAQRRCLSDRRPRSYAARLWQVQPLRPDLAVRHRRSSYAG